MRRRVTHETKIIWRSNNTIAKVVHPNTIHDHSGSKPIFVGGDPISQNFAAPRRMRTLWNYWQLWRAASQELWKLCLHRFGGTMWAAADEYVCFVRLWFQRRESHYRLSWRQRTLLLVNQSQLGFKFLVLLPLCSGNVLL